MSQRLSEGMVEIFHMDVLQQGKIAGALYLAIGLIMGVLYGLFGLLMAVGGLIGGEASAAGAGIGIALFAVIGFPLLYGFLGFVIGIIGALIYNVVAKFAGGVRIELKTVR